MTEYQRIIRRANGGPVRARIALLAIGLSLVGVSCSGDESSTPKSTDGTQRRPTTTTTAASATSDAISSSSTSSTSVSTGRSVNDKIAARYIAFWEARFAANSGVPKPDDPALRDHATGEQLETVVNETQANLERGVAYRRAAKPSCVQRVAVLEVDGDHAVVQECVVADGVIVRRDLGEIVNDDVATHNIRGELVRVDGVWKVSSARLIQRWEGVAGCALDS